MMPTIDLQALIDWHKSDLQGKGRADLKAIRDDFREKAEDLLSEFEEYRGLIPQQAIEHIEAEHAAQIREIKSRGTEGKARVFALSGVEAIKQRRKRKYRCSIYYWARHLAARQLLNPVDWMKSTAADEDDSVDWEEVTKALEKNLGGSDAPDHALQFLAADQQAEMPITSYSRLYKKCSEIGDVGEDAWKGRHSTVRTRLREQGYQWDGVREFFGALQKAAGLR
jgi:hypothetical protein